VRRAFETVAVKAGVKPIVIGSVPKDLGMETLTGIQAPGHRDGSGQFPTRSSFQRGEQLRDGAAGRVEPLDDVLKPEAEMIEDGFNEPAVRTARAAYGIPVQEARGVPAPRGSEGVRGCWRWCIGGVMTPNELRERLDLEPTRRRRRAARPAAPPTSSPSPSVGQQDGPLPRTNGGMARRLAQDLGTRAKKALELAQWQRKALKALKTEPAANVPFKFDAWTPADTEQVESIERALETASTPEEVKAAFSAAPFRLPSYP
jgi:hypothetical protein